MCCSLLQPLIHWQQHIPVHAAGLPCVSILPLLSTTPSAPSGVTPSPTIAVAVAVVIAYVTSPATSIAITVSVTPPPATGVLAAPSSIATTSVAT